MNEIKKNWRKWLYWFFLGVAIIAVYKTLDNFTNILSEVKKFFSVIGPFLSGILIAYLLYVPCNSIEQKCKKSKNRFVKKKARGISILVTYFVTLIIILLLFRFILPVVTASVMDLADNAQKYYETALRNYNKIPEDNILKTEVINEAIQNIKNVNIKQYFEVDKILNYVMSALSAVTSLFDIFVAVIVSIYILIERTEIVKFFKKLAGATFSENTYKSIERYFNKTNQVFFKFLISQFIDAIVVGILVTVVLSIMGVKYAPLLGFLIGLFNMIPYFGAIVAVAISAIITLVTGGLSKAIWMLIVVIILQQVDANIINPKIVGKSLKISPLLVIFAVLIGGAYFGIIGMFLGVPIITILKIFIEDYVEFKNKNRIIEN